MNTQSVLRRLSTCVRNCHSVHRTGQRLYASAAASTTKGIWQILRQLFRCL